MEEVNSWSSACFGSRRRTRGLRSCTTGYPRASGGLCFPRKEVIQPQVPLRLPCYDLVPITEHTFGVALPEGLDSRLRVHPAFVA